MSERLPHTAIWAGALMCAVPALLPFSRAAELPILLGAAVSVLALWRRQAWSSNATISLCLVLGAYSLAALLSAADAAASAKSWSTALSTLRFLGFAVGICYLLQQALAAGAPATRLSRMLMWVAALPLAVWTLDALIQSASGWSLGGTLDADRLSGIFGADDLKLGPLLSALAPLLLWPWLDRSRLGLAITWLALLLVVLLAGARAGWISYALVSALLAWRLARGSWRALLLWLSAAGLAVLLFSALSYHYSETFRARVDRTMAAGAGQVDVALAGRMPIWRTAGRMIAAHPINGVGVRSFRYAYPDYADANDPWVDPVLHTGAAHAHQIVLEVLTETGILGLGLWLGAGVLLWRRARASMARRAPFAHALAAPWVALAVLVFPLNTHLAFYSSFMGLVLAWLLTLAFAQTLVQEYGQRDAQVLP